jgi:hypothetical protein
MNFKPLTMEQCHDDMISMAMTYYQKVLKISHGYKEISRRIKHQAWRIVFDILNLFYHAKWVEPLWTRYGNSSPNKTPFLAITHLHKAAYEYRTITCYSIPWSQFKIKQKKIHCFLTSWEELELTWSCPVDRKKSFKNSCL